ncbi:hypothetical protein V6N11_063531 [Hibiscus sabdariffa]|uniref:Uncharacterized protein n=1 Tax=Hibiscus sabdariffa TaxID=183260 RepID=A0ABR1ZH84_9ROSI
MAIAAATVIDPLSLIFFISGPIINLFQTEGHWYSRGSSMERGIGFKGRGFVGHVKLGVEARVLHLGSCNDWPKQPWGLFVNEFSGCVIVFLWPLCTKCQGTWQQRNEPVWASRRAISVVVQRYSGYNP